MKEITIPYLLSAFLLHNTAISKVIPDEAYLKFVFRGYTGYHLNLKKPQTFNEKIQWLKLYDRRPEYTTMVDKYAVKNYVADKIGEQYIIPTLGVWQDVKDVDFNLLPEQFVLKCTHDSGGLVIVRDKKTMDLVAIKKKINKSVKRNFYYYGREWPYKNVQPQIIAEKFLEDTETKELRDYKFFCFNGVPRVLFIATDRGKEGTETKFDFYDMKFQHLDIRNGHPNADIPPNKPKNFEKMKELASILSNNIPYLRVDFYEVNGKVYFGELTFSHWSGMMPFEPESWDYKLGEWINLPQK